VSHARIALCLVIHNHQPVGNFGFVLEANHRLAYAPMLDALERHPGVRVGLHYTGPLLEWLKEEQPGTVAQLGRLVAREQIEILGGGYYEPVLSSLPGRDRSAQLERMARELAALFGGRPTGAWLAERVWEPDLPLYLADAGYAYTILDDAHLRAAAIPDSEHWGAYATDDQGRRLTVFGTEQGLRYRIPFRPVEEVIDYLRAHATEGGERVGTMGDDGEKFGAWPGTWERCWGKEAWVERFLTALDENADWLTTLRPGDALRRHPPVGRTYLPTGSYAEMGEWALPLEARREYSRLLHAAVAEGRPEARWMRGGFWRTFQVTYREVNDLHKQMLRVSDRVAEVAASVASDPGPAVAARVARMTDHLLRGQSNDCYWHGLFGGIYLSHMRLATLAHLIAAEDAADRLAPRRPSSATVIADVDLDGRDEVLVSGPGQVVAIKPDEGGGIGRWDVRAARHALASVMRRRPEAYHDTLRALEDGTATASDTGAVSIHDLVRVTELDLAERLWYDRYERRSGLVHLLPRGTTPGAFQRAAYEELGDFVDGSFGVALEDDGSVELGRDGGMRLPDGSLAPLRVRKRLRFVQERLAPAIALEVEVANTGGASIDALLGVEWSLNLLGGGGNPQAWYEVGGERHAFDSSGQVTDARVVAMGNDGLGVALESGPVPRASAWWHSIETISLSEQGFERNHQGSCLMWVWPLELAAGASLRVRIENLVSCARDRAEEEGL
jgi:4-alpha-glucanotransferase